MDREITPHVPVWDKSARHDGTFSRADFVFDQERNVYICPGGAELTSTGNIDQGHIVYYRANKQPMRKITRDVKVPSWRADLSHTGTWGVILRSTSHLSSLATP